MKDHSGIPSILKIGWINYWNLQPFRRELNRLSEDGISLETGVPTKVNHWLQEGRVHLAPSSSICLAGNSSLEMALPMGVIADGPVMSVYLGFQKEHEELLEALRERRRKLRDICLSARSIYQGDARYIARQMCMDAKKLPPLPVSLLPGLRVTSESASSAALGRILYKLWFGEEAYQLMVDRDVSEKVYTRRPVELLIGDRALLKKPLFHKTLDLGTVWKEMTGLPFVYAVWQSRGSCLNGWRRKVLDIGQVAENRMRVEPSVYLPENNPVDEAGQKIPLADYWKCIYYRLGPSEMKGLLIFLCLARSMNLVPAADNVLARIIRWQDLSLRDSIPVS